MSDNPLHSYWGAAVGLGQLTRDRAEALVRLLVQQSEAAADLAERSLEELLRAPGEDGTLAALSGGDPAHVQRLEIKVDELERRVEALELELSLLAHRDGPDAPG